MLESLIRLGRRATDPLSICLRLGLITGTLGGLILLMSYIAYGPSPTAPTWYVSHIFYLTLPVFVFIYSGLRLFSKLPAAGLVRPIAALSVTSSVLIVTLYSIHPRSELGLLYGLVSGILTGAGYCRLCSRGRDQPIKKHSTQPSVVHPPDALTGYFLVVLILIGSALTVVSLTLGATLQAAGQSLSQAAGLGPVGINLLLGIILVLAATGYFYSIARTNVQGRETAVQGVVVGVRHPLQGFSDFIVPFASDPLRIDLLASNASRPEFDQIQASDARYGHRPILWCFFGTPALLVITLFSVLGTALSFLLLYWLSMRFWSSACLPTAPCTLPPVEWFSLAGATAGLTAASLLGHLATAFSIDRPGSRSQISFECQHRPNGRVLDITGELAVLPEGAGAPGIWFVNEVTPIGRLAPDHPTLANELDEYLSRTNGSDAPSYADG